MIEPVQKENREPKPIAFNGWPLGENTALPPNQLRAQELASCIDFKMQPGGKPESREAITKYTDTAIGTPESVESCSLSGTQYDICSDEDTVYYLSGTTPTTIGTVEGPSDITAYKGAAIISDGSYLKYCDDVTGVKIAYDGGDDGTQYDNYSGSDDGAISGTRVAAKFTSQDWDTGFTIPITKIKAKVIESGGTASITARLRRVSDDQIFAVKEYTDVVPSSAADFITIAFTDADVLTEMAPNTEYYASLEGSNFLLQCTTVTSGGVAYTYSGSWSADTTKNPLMKVYPGRPPKAEWSIVSGTRLWVYDPDRPGGLWYGNLSQLDFSTNGYGGWLGVIDQDRNSFKVGAAQDLYGTLYVFGTEDQPFLCRLEGSTPSEYSLPLMFQRAWATQKTLKNTGSDLWFSSKGGTDSLYGVQEFGDLRAFSFSDPIKGRFSNWDTDTAISGYNPKDGQYWLYMPGYDYVSVCHTKQPIRDDSGKLVYPWTRYTLPATPKVFSQVGGDFLIGASDGFFYKLDADAYKDLGTTQIHPELSTSYIEFPYGTVDVDKIQIVASSLGGSKMDIDIFKNGNYATSINTYSLSLGMSDSLTVGDVSDIEVGDVDDLPVTPAQNPTYFNVNFNCRSFQIKVSNIHIVGFPVFLSGMFINYRQVEG